MEYNLKGLHQGGAQKRAQVCAHAELLCQCEGLGDVFPQLNPLALGECEAARPSALQPSDERLVREMRARLAEEPWVSNRGIVVQAKDGVLSLWGLVLTETEKSAVETMARTIEGCKGIDSHLVVKSDFPYRYAV